MSTSFYTFVRKGTGEVICFVPCLLSKVNEINQLSRIFKLMLVFQIASFAGHIAEVIINLSRFSFKMLLLLAYAQSVNTFPHVLEGGLFIEGNETNFAQLQYSILRHRQYLCMLQAISLVYGMDQDVWLFLNPIVFMLTQIAACFLPPLSSPSNYVIFIDSCPVLILFEKQ